MSHDLTQGVPRVVRKEPSAKTNLFSLWLNSRAESPRLVLSSGPIVREVLGVLPPSSVPIVYSLSGCPLVVLWK